MNTNEPIKIKARELQSSGIHSCHDNCKRPACVLRRELKQVTKERDELLVSLNELLPFVDPKIGNDRYNNAREIIQRFHSPQQKSK